MTVRTRLQERNLSSAPASSCESGLNIMEQRLWLEVPEHQARHPEKGEKCYHIGDGDDEDRRGQRRVYSESLENNRNYSADHARNHEAQDHRRPEHDPQLEAEPGRDDPEHDDARGHPVDEAHEGFLDDDPRARVPAHFAEADASDDD